MIRWLVGSGLDSRFMVVAVAAGIIIVGILRLPEVPMDVFPEFAPPIVEIQTEALGLSTAEVESLITLNLEELLSGISWLQTIRSESIPGLSSILLIFEPGTDVMKARQLVQERLSLAYTLPNVSKPPVMLQPFSATRRVMMVGLSSDDLSLIQMSVLARWTIKPRLMGVPGVANVAIWGQRNRQIQVQINPRRLQDQGVTQAQILSTAGDALWVSPLTFLNASTPGTGGWIDTPNQRLEVRHVSAISSPEDLAQVPVDGSTLRLGEVADVVEAHPPLIGDALLNGRPGLLLVVEKFPGANTSQVTRGVEAALEALRPGLPTVQVDATIFRAATYIEAAIENLTMALFIGCALVVAALGLFFFDWRAVMISCMAIPLSLIAAALVITSTGSTINAMVLAGLAIAVGVVVDDAIVDVENILRRLRQQKSRSGRSTAAVILDASLEVRSAIIYATLVIVLAVAPVFFMVGLSGAFFRPLALSYSLAVGVSMLVALVATPALALVLLRKDPLAGPEESPPMRFLQRRYNVIIARVIDRPAPVFIGAAAVLLLGLAALPFLGESLLPALKETDLTIDWEAPPGTSLPEMTRMTNRVSRELGEIAGVRNVAAHVGRAVTGDRIVGINSSQLWVSIDPKSGYDETIAAVREVLNGYPGVRHDLHTYLKERIREVLTGSREAIIVRLFGSKLGVLRQKAEEVKQALGGIDGLVDLRVEQQVEEPHVEVQVDLAAAEPYGLKPGDVRRAAATIFAGVEVGHLFEEQKVFEVVVWGAPETRRSLTDIVELLIHTPSGRHVQLGDIADVRITSTPTVIRREAISPRLDVVANVHGRDLGSAAREVEDALRRVEFPLEYHPEVLGEYVERQAAQRRLAGIALAAAVGIFLLLQACFQSWRLATLAFLALPAALIGGVLATCAAGGSVSLGSLVGFLAVLGIAARNGIMLINHYQRLERHEPFGTPLVLRGTQERFAPIMMTATTAGLALLPLVVFGDIAGLEIVHPMAVVILGGLVTSTSLNLLIVPVLYLRRSRRRSRRRNLDSQAVDSRTEPPTDRQIAARASTSS